MTTRENIGILIVGVLGCTLLLQRCNKSTTFKGPSQISYKDGGDVIVVQQKGKKPVQIYEPDPRSTVITTDAHGNVSIRVRHFGVGFEPGIGFGYSNKTRLALDARVVYFNRFGAHTGLGVSMDANDYSVHTKLLDLVDPYVGISYVPWLRFPNTSVVASYTLSKHPFVFVRLRF